MMKSNRFRSVRLFEDRESTSSAPNTYNRTIVDSERIGLKTDGQMLPKVIKCDLIRKEMIHIHSGTYLHNKRTIRITVTI